MSPFEITSLVLTGLVMVAGAGNVFVTLKVHAELADIKAWALKTFVLRKSVALSNPKPTRNQRREHHHVG